MSMFDIRTEGDPRPWLRRLGEDMESPNGSRLVKSMGTAAAKTVRNHFRALDAQRHRGLSTRNFYGGAAGATDYEVDDKGIVVVVGDGQFPGNSIALRYFGGVVKPRNAKYLTIPVADEAEGKRVWEIENKLGDSEELSWIVNRRTGKGVITLGDRVLYALTKKTTHKADKTVLPTADELAGAMAAAAEPTLRRIQRGQ